MIDHEEIHPDDSIESRQPHRASLRLILMLVVNLGVLLSVGSLLVYDYQREIHEQLQGKQLALRDEAKTLRPAVEELQHHGEEEIQKYIDRVCSLMQTDSSPGHHIMARVGETLLQSKYHRQASDILMKSMMDLADNGSGIGEIHDHPIIIGRSELGGVALYVSEMSSPVYASARGHFFTRALYVLLFAFIGMGLINYLLVRMVTRPVDQMVDAVRRLGTGDLHTRSSRFHAAEFDYLAAEFNRMAQHLESANREREAQLVKARRIQTNLMPAHPQIPGFSLSIIYEPATEVGGDFYDVLKHPDGSWTIALGDVSGHGVPAALGAAMLKTLLNEACRESTVPGEILARLNYGFRQVTLPGDFATMILIYWNPDNLSLRYASAGHETGYIIRVNHEDHIKIIPLSSSGIILGIEAKPIWMEAEHQLYPGDILLFCTDGVIESFNHEGDQYGRSRLIEIISQTILSPSEVSAEEIASAVRNDVKGFRGEVDALDDLTLFALQVQS